MSDNQSRHPLNAPHSTAGTQPKPAVNIKPNGLGKPKLGPKPGKDANKPLQALHDYPGSVIKFEANPDGVLDRFLLETAGRNYTVKFPSHFGQELLALAQPGRAVAVLSFLKATRRGDEYLHLARLDAAGATAPLLPDAAPMQVARPNRPATPASP